jgi:hypothetical protein
MERTLGPWNAGGLIKETFTIYKNNFWRLAAIIAVSAISSATFGFFIKLFVGTSAQTMRWNWDLIWILIISYPIIIILSIFTGGAAIQAVAQQYLNRPINLGWAFSSAGWKIGVMLGATLLVALATAGMAITIIGIPAAIYFGTTWSFILQVALLEHCGPRKALSYSSSLVKGNWWRVVGIMVLFGLIVWGISAVLSFPVTIATVFQTFTRGITGAPMEPSMGFLIASTIVSTIAGIIGAPIFIIGETLLYFDLRVRKQGYSLDNLSRELKSV